MYAVLGVRLNQITIIAQLEIPTRKKSFYPPGNTYIEGK
jgi:hypothetical protein